MAIKKRVMIVIVAAVLALLAGAAYMTRGYWLGPLTGAGETEGGFNVVVKDGVKYKECYTCPMHTQIIKPAPGDCPICGMTLVKKLIPLEGQQEEKGAMKNMSGMRGGEMPGEKQAMPEAEKTMLEAVSLDPRQRIIANVATSKVEYREISGDVYTVGRVAINEDTIKKEAAWFPGRIERIYFHYPGEYVKKGQRIMSVYSPELVSTQKEYLIAKGAADRLESAGFPEVTKSTNDVIEAARTRMRLWGVSDDQIQKLDKTGVPDGSLDVYSKVSGTLTDIKAREGGYVTEGSELFTVADYGSVWVNAEVYEYEFSKVSMGARVEITADAYPGRVYHGRVSFIDPEVDSQSRTVRLRAVIQNRGGQLKPEMFVNAHVLSKPRKALSVPASAVLYTGRRNIVWVQSAPGEYEPHDVTLGLRSGDEYEVLSGLSDGMTVVTQGGFLIDSEAELKKSAGGGMSMPGMDMGGGSKKSGSEKMDIDTDAAHQH
jgi:membrane fusion protein, copper/silver efflux system